MKKRILMTGCGSGFGASLRTTLELEGHTVVSIGMHKDDNYEYNFETLGWESYREIIWKIVQENPDWFDVLINNAGAMHLNFLGEYGEEQICDAISVNLLAPLALMKFFTDECEGRRFPPENVPAGGGWRIINTVSMAVKTPPRACIGYVAAKAGLEAATRALAREFAGRPYIFASVAPCGVKYTEMQQQGLEHLVQRRGMSPEAATKYQSANPMGRLAEHDEICRVFEFAVNEMPPIMSGTTLWIPAACGA